MAIGTIKWFSAGVNQVKYVFITSMGAGAPMEIVYIA